MIKKILMPYCISIFGHKDDDITPIFVKKSWCAIFYSTHNSVYTFKVRYFSHSYNFFYILWKSSTYRVFQFSNADLRRVFITFWAHSDSSLCNKLFLPLSQES